MIQTFSDYSNPMENFQYDSGLLVNIRIQVREQSGRSYDSVYKHFKSIIDESGRSIETSAQNG